MFEIIIRSAQELKKTSTHLFGIRISVKIDIYEKKNIFNNIIILTYHEIQNKTKKGIFIDIFPL